MAAAHRYRVLGFRFGVPQQVPAPVDEFRGLSRRRSFGSQSSRLNQSRQCEPHRRRHKLGATDGCGDNGAPVVETNSIGMQLVLIPAGEFMMGSPATEEGRQATRQQHRVRITRPFYLGV